MTFRSRLHGLRVALWGPPPASPQEARLIRKIDFLVLTFTCLMYWSNYLSRTGFQFAYVSGMSTDLSFKGNDYSIANTLFTVGYIIGMIPNILALQIVDPHYWLPGTAALWSGLAMCLAAAKNPSQVFAIRFLQGVVEASTFAGSHYVLGSWYTETEIGKRSGIFAASAQLGSLFSGVIQGGIHANLDGYRGLASWQWQFLMDGFIGIPIALYGFIFFPDVPARARKWLLTAEERKLAITRLPARQRSHTRMGWSLVKRVLGRWHWYAFSALFAWSSMLESIGSNGLFALWLQAEDYPISKRDYWPLSLQAVAIASTIVAAAVTDLPQVPRWTVNPVMAASLIFTSIVLLIWTVPFGLKFAAFTLGGMGYAGQATNFSWANIVCAGDEQERAVVLASMNLWSSTVQAWWSIVFYPASDAPRFHRGWIAMICVAFVTVAIALTVRHLELRERKQQSEELVQEQLEDDDGDATVASSPTETEKAPSSAALTSRRSRKSHLGFFSSLALMAPMLCLFVAAPQAQAEATSSSFFDDDDFHESLHLRPLPTGRVQSAFTFTLSSTQSPFSSTSTSGRHFGLLPASLLSTIEASELPIEELSLSFNKGRWDYERWGTPTFFDGPSGSSEWGSSMVATGAEVWARYDAPVAGGSSSSSGQHPSPYEADVFHGLLSRLSGQFCSTLAAAGSREAISVPSNLTRGLYTTATPQGEHGSGKLVMHLSSPPSPCTEVLHPMLSLLPCKRAAGLASVLEPHAWLETEWHGIELNVRRRRGDAGWDVVVKVGSVWSGVSRSGKRDFSMSKILGGPLTSTCPLASSSFVSLVAPADGSDYTAEPLQAASFHHDVDSPEAQDDDDDEARAKREHPLVTLAGKLRNEGQLRYDVAPFLSSNPALDVSLSWLSEERFNHTTERQHALSSSPIPSLSVRRSFISTDVLQGTLLLLLHNPRPDRPRRLIYRDVLPWFLDLDLPSSTSTTTLHPLDPSSPYIRFDDDERHDAVRRVRYTPSEPRRGPVVLELEIVVPPASDVAWRVRFDKETLRYEEHPPDAHRGLDVGAATVWEVEDDGDDDEDESSSRRRAMRGRIWKTQVGLIEVAVPDFSMPYNVIIFTSTILALFAGSAVNVLTRRFVDVEVPPEVVKAAASAGAGRKGGKGKEVKEAVVVDEGGGKRNGRATEVEEELD